MAERDTQKIDERVAQEKADLLEALSKTSAIVSSACKAANVSRMTYYRYYNEDPEFREKADDMNLLRRAKLHSGNERQSRFLRRFFNSGAVFCGVMVGESDGIKPHNL